MAHTDRAAAIAEIEAIRGSKVITYVTGDRNPVATQIHDDALRPIYEQLRDLGTPDKLDLFIYSRGGATDVPWRIANALRKTCPNWNVLIPFRANSAATLLALGAEEIVLGRNGELGPIDPTLGVQRIVPNPGGGQIAVPDQIPVEDIMAYLRFVQERGGISDQAALSASMTKLTERIDAVTLGNAYRTHSHIRDVARRMLTSRVKPATQSTIEKIVETLAEKVYAHGHAISFGDAEEIGLPVQPANAALDAAMWKLLKVYEADMKLLAPLDPQAVTAAADYYSEPAVLGAIDTRAYAYELTGEVQVRVKRQIPQAINVNLTLTIAAPNPAALGGAPTPAQQAALQAWAAQTQQQIGAQAQQAAQQAIRAQAPIIGYDVGVRGGAWKKLP